MNRQTPRTCIDRLILAAAVGLAAAVLPVAAQDPGPDDRRNGEQDRIDRRHEWFWSSRRAGVASAAEAAALRWSAVQDTRVAIEQQALRRAIWEDSTENFWVSMGPSPSHFGNWSIGDVSGRVAAMTADWSGGVLYVGSASGGLWKSTNDGLSWTSIFDTAGTLTIGSVTVDPNDPDTLWVGTGENNQGCESYFGIGLLRSTDGGATWETRNGTGGNTLDDLSSFADVVVDPRDSNRLITGGRIRGCSGGSSQSGGLYTSDDAGLTWTLRLPDTSVYEIQRDPAVLDILWTATSSGIYKSEDNGVTWTLQTRSKLPNGSTGRTELAISPSDGNVVYALFQNDGLWQTTNGGHRWRLMSVGRQACDGQCSYNMVLRVHNTDPDTVYRGTVHVFKSSDGGGSWVDLSNDWGSSQKVHQDTHVLLMDPSDPDTFWVGSDGGVWKSTDGGQTFLNRNGDLNLTQFYAVGVHPTDTDILCGGAQDNSSLVRDGNNTWELQVVTGDGFVCHFDDQNPNYAYTTSYPNTYPNVYRSTAGMYGPFTIVTRSGIQQNDRINWVTPYVLDPSNPSTLYLGTHRVYRSDDHGNQWTQVGPTDLTGGSGSLRVLEINRNHTGVVFAGSTSGKIWRSVNGGATWDDISAGLPSRQITDIAADPSDPDHALATVGGFNTAHLWEWTPSGGWVGTGGGLANVPANTVLMRTSTDVFVGNDTGILRSSDSGATLEPYMDGLPQGLVVTDLRYTESLDVITAGTYGRGAWQVVVGPVTPDVVFDSFEQPLVEVDGDGDGDVEPGEAWDVRPNLRNRGGEAALGVQARLASPTPGVTLLDPAVRDYGDIGSGAIVGALTHHRFVVDPTVPCGSDIVFDLRDVTSANAPGIYADQASAFTVNVASDCQVTLWPGSVPATIRLDPVGGDIEVTWSDSCNIVDVPGQTYSVQVGDLDLLLASGTYSHAPVGSDCGRTSPSVVTPGPGNEYYLVLPNSDGREGGAGDDSSGAVRPQVVNSCGEHRVAVCP